MEAKYTLLYRPPSFCTLPKGWTIVERPALGLGFDRRTDLPISSYRFGVVSFPSKLSAEDVKAFELKEV